MREIQRLLQYFLHKWDFY